MQSIRVSIVEDQEDIREGMRFLINQSAAFSCVSTYTNAEEPLTDLPRVQPDLVVMDIHLPGITGIECIRRLKPQHPQMQFIMFTVFEDSDQVFEALAAGASGYLLKKTPPDKIISALQELYDGGAPMSATIARKVISLLQQRPPAPQPVPVAEYKLSPREHDILNLLAKGLFYKEIAAQLLISTGTVRQHIHNIYEKLHVQNRTEALNKVAGR